MARVITNAPPGMVVVHLNHDTLDCRRSNLQVVDRGTMLHWAGPNSNKDKPSGVYFVRARRRYEAHIGYAGRMLYLGHFRTSAAAMIARDQKARELYGAMARENRLEGSSWPR